MHVHHQGSIATHNHIHGDSRPVCSQHNMYLQTGGPPHPLAHDRVAQRSTDAQHRSGFHQTSASACESWPSCWDSRPQRQGAPPTSRPPSAAWLLLCRCKAQEKRLSGDHQRLHIELQYLRERDPELPSCCCVPCRVGASTNARRL